MKDKKNVPFTYIEKVGKAKQVDSELTFSNMPSIPK
jgi:hypothetical protein